jgi:hypothetical protein
MQQVISYVDIATLIERGSGIVRFGTAPDGLPFLATVPAPPRATNLLRQAAWAMGVVANEPRYDGTPLEPLVSDLNRILREHLVQRLETADGERVEVMILPLAVRSLVGATLLERLIEPPQPPPRPVSTFRHSSIPLGPSGGPPGGEGGEEADRAPDMLRAGDVAPMPPVPQPRARIGELCLALPRAGGQPVIVYRMHSENGWPEYTFQRSYTEEAATLLRDSWYEKFSRFAAVPGERVPVGDAARYRRLRAAAPETPWTWQVSRRGLAAILLDLAAQVGSLHERDEIHGDLKPAKVLITERAATPLDSLRLAPGVRSSAMTRGWAAPEQVLGLAVSPQTDQYPFGLLLLRLVGGVLYGEEARVSIPVGGTQLEYHTVLRNPGVYIDPATAPVERAQVDAWRDLIERCVRFEPTDRFPTMADLAEALRPLIDADTLTGTLETPLSFGRLVSGSDGESEPELCWLVS